MHNKCWYPQVAPVYFLPIQAALLCSRRVREIQRKHEREHYMMITERDWDAESTYQMCAPAGSACACVCAVSGLSSCLSGTCAGPPRLKRCRPRIQLEVKRETSVITTVNSRITNIIIIMLKMTCLCACFMIKLKFLTQLASDLGSCFSTSSMSQVCIISKSTSNRNQEKSGTVNSRVLHSRWEVAMLAGVVLVSELDVHVGMWYFSRGWQKRSDSW